MDRNPTARGRELGAQKPLTAAYDLLNLRVGQKAGPELDGQPQHLHDAEHFREADPEGWHLRPGLGGHCIPIDPFYLSWKARQSGFEARFIELAGQVNSSMPEWVVTRIADALNTVKKAVNGSRVHVYGVAYKKNVGDMRESPALDVIEHLVRRGALVTYSDPYVPSFKTDGHSFTAIGAAEALAAKPDCVVITTDHDVFDYKELVEKAPLIMDARNALKTFNAAHIHRL